MIHYQAAISREMWTKVGSATRDPSPILFAMDHRGWLQIQAYYVRSR